MGYTGGLTQSPTYHDLADHTEALQVDFAPGEISLQRVLDLFWKGHQPQRANSSVQYRSAIWFADEHQRDAILTSYERVQNEIDGKIKTPVLPLERFWRAEDYHQKYRLQRNKDVMAILRTMYPEFDDFVDSTAAARLNGFAAGWGDRALFEAERETYGIPRDRLEEVVRPRWK